MTCLKSTSFQISLTFPYLVIFLINSLTFPGFPGWWQPCTSINQLTSINHWYVIDMCLQVVYDLCCVFYKFLHILPPELFRLFCSRAVPFDNHSNIFVIKLEVLLGFEYSQIFTHGFLGCQFPRKYSIFDFGQFLMHQNFRVFYNSWICYF